MRVYLTVYSYIIHYILTHFNTLISFPTPYSTPVCRSTIVKKIVENLAEISSAEGLRVGLWILGEYASAPDPGVREYIGGVCVVCVVYVHGVYCIYVA